MHAEMEAAGIQELIDDIQYQLDEHLAKQAAQAKEAAPFSDLNRASTSY